MPNFAGAGLALQGSNAAQADTMNLRTQQLGLDEMERTNAVNQDVRNVAQAGGSHEDMARAAESRGDYARAEEHRRHGKALEDESIKSVVHRALIDPTPGNRPDLVEEANRYGKGKGMTSMTLDEKGNLSFVGSKSGTMNIGLAAERMGLVKPFEHVMPAGSTYVRNNPVSGTTTTVTAPPAEKYAATRTGTIFDQATGDVKYTPPDDNWALGEITHGDRKVPVSFNKKTGEAVVLGPGGHPEKAQVHTGPDGKTTVTIGNKLFEVTPGTPGTPGSSGFLGFGGRPATPATPPTLTEVSQPGAASAPPVEGARQAPDGKWYLKTAGGYSEVISNGSGQTAAPSAPAAAPKPAAVPHKPPTTAPAAAQAQVRNAAPQGEFEGVETPLQKVTQSISRVMERSTQQQVDFYKKKISDGKIDGRDKNVIRALAKSHPNAFSISELKAAGIPVEGRASGGKVQRYGLQ